MKRRLRILVPGLLLAGFLALPAAAAPRSYQLGLDALEAGDFQAAESYLRQALREDSSPGGRYHPYYYLGVVRLRLNDCPGALAEWQQSARRERLPDKLAEELRSYRRFCEQTDDVEGINRRTERLMRTVGEVHGKVQQLHQDLRLAGAWSEPLEAQRLEVLGQVARAERNLKEAQRPPWRLKEAQVAEAAALKALDLLEAAYRDAQSQWAEIQQRIEADKAQEQDKGGGGGDEDDRGTIKGPILPPPPHPKTPQPPDLLLRAADALFAGNYGETLEILEGQTFANDQAEAHANLFRAAAHYALYLTGMDDLDHQSYARTYADAARRHDPGLSPLARVFSPRFRDFFRDGHE